jgi:hypothetical protein
MPIKVLVKCIDFEDIKKIIRKYNELKEPNDEELEILERCESGFMIKNRNYYELSGDENKKIKQFRWKYGYLRPYEHYKGFDLQEEMLLYFCMKEVLYENVIFEN